MNKENIILSLNSNPYCLWKGKGMHKCTSSFWSNKSRCKLLIWDWSSKGSELRYPGHILVYWNHSLNFVTICWTKLPCSLININIIILFIKKKPLLNDQEKHIGLIVTSCWTHIHTAYKNNNKLNWNLALILKLIDSIFFWSFNKEKKNDIIMCLNQIKKKSKSKFDAKFE